MSKKISLKLNKNMFSDFVSKLQNLSQIKDILKIKISKEKILMYSMISNDSAVLALKTYILNTKDYIDNFEEEEDYDLIITSSTKFVKRLKFLDPQNDIKLNIVSKALPDDNSIMHVRSMQFVNGKRKISEIGAEEFKIRDIGIDMLNSKLNPSLSKYSFRVSQSDFVDIKKLSNIDSEDRVLNINIDNKKVIFNESNKWEVEVADIDYDNEQLSFIKKYLSSIDDSELIEFSVYEYFILVKNEVSNLMLSFETKFEDE